MTTPGLVISTDTSTCLSISLILPHKMRSLYWLPNTISRDSMEAHVSFEQAKPRKPWYLIWKQMSTSSSSRSPISHPHSDFEPDAREIRESLGDLTSASPQTHKSAEKFTQMLCYLLLILFLSILKIWAKRVHRLFQRCCPILQFWGNQYNSHYNNMCACYGVWFPKTRPCSDPDTWLDLISFSITRPILEVVNDQEAGPAIMEAVKKLIEFRT